jgi:5-methylcytosine-specific restriction protein B
MSAGNMAEMTLDQNILDELKELLERGLASGELMTTAQIAAQIGLFRTRFGPQVLRDLDGEALLQLMDGRDKPESKCLVYWLEFKNDDEFTGIRFGSIAGGSALKFGLFQRAGVWITGSPNQQRTIPLSEAIVIARRQRDELLAGDKVLAAFDSSNYSDEAYAGLQSAISEVAPELSGTAWAHKYWFLIHSDRLDDFHSPRYQRFHLLKLLQMPPDGIGVRDWGAPRFVCAGRFISLARRLQVSVTTLDSVLNQRNGFHRYWRIPTKRQGQSQWPVMHDGGFVSIGWSEQVPDLSNILGQDKARDQIRDWLLPAYPGNSVTASRKAGEILKFAQEMGENDLVLACEERNVLGVGARSRTL